MPLRPFAPFAAIALFVVAACSDNGPRSPGSLEKVSGEDQAGFAGAELPSPLVVRVRDSEGKSLPGARVTWDIVEGGGSISPATSTTNSNGIAQAEWTLGASDGPHEATATVGSLEPALFSAETFGQADCFGDPHALAVGEPVVLTGAQASDICVSVGVGGGEYVAVAHHGGLATDTVHLQAFGAFEGAIADVGMPGPSLSLGASQGFGPSQRIEAPAVQRDERFHRDLRRRERALAPMIPGARAALGEQRQLGVTTPSYAIGSLNPQVGDLVTINAQSRFSCSNPINKQGRIAAVSDRAIIVHDTENPTGGFTDAEYHSMALTFDTLIDPMAVANFGAPEDIDANGKVFIFYTNEVNKLTERGSGSYIGGFYFVRDLFPKVATPDFQACATSNEAEVFYMLVPDPDGEVSDKRTKEFVLRVTVGTIAHEYQHLINASRRMFVNNAFQFEETWLDEGLAHIAEELTFYESAGLAPGSNLDLDDVKATTPILEAFNRFGINNLFRFEDFLEAPSLNSPYNTDDALATRGAAWHFLRYAADRRGGDEQPFWFDLVNSTFTGLQNLQNVLGTVDPWVRDWASAVLLDDLVAGAPAAYRFPSWNLRSIWTANPPFSGSYPLVVENLSLGGPIARDVIGGGATYLRLTLGSSDAGAMQIRVDGMAPGADVTVTLVRTR